MGWREITRNAAGYPVQATAPNKIRDAIETFLHQMTQALVEDGLDERVATEEVYDLRQPLVDLARGVNDRIIADWEDTLVARVYAEKAAGIQNISRRQR